MKGSNNTLLFILGGILLLAIAAYFIFIFPNIDNYHWRETYNDRELQPYNTSLIFKLADSYFPDHPVESSEKPFRFWQAYEDQHYNYISIGENVFFSEVDVDSLLAFADRGNQVFIVSKRTPYELLDYLILKDCEYYGYSAIEALEVRMNFNSPTFQKEYIYAQKNNQTQVPHSWYYLDSISCDPEINFLGTLNDTISNFIEIPYGEGGFLLHCNPLVFTDYHMIRPEGKEYIEKTLSFLSPGTIYWDNHNKIGSYGDEGQRTTQAPLQFILSHSGLRWAWYLLLGTALLYMLFYGKRRQRIIPILPFSQNSTIEFTETIGRLYFLQKNHRKIGLQKMRMFLEFIRDRYHLKTQDLNVSFMEQLNKRSGVELSKIESIFKMYKRMQETEETTEYLLVEFNRAIEKFHHQCK